MRLSRCVLEDTLIDIVQQIVSPTHEVAEDMSGLAHPRIFTCRVSNRRLLLFCSTYSFCITPNIDILHVLNSDPRMWNPLYVFAPLALLMVSIPLAIFAAITTSFAISLLSFRVLTVYVQLGTAIVGTWLLPTPPKQTSVLRPTSPPSSERTSPNRRRRRRSSNVSTASSTDVAAPPSNAPCLPRKSGSFAALFSNNDLTRDFEGVGGWRVPGGEDEEALWMGINSRLQLPADTPPRRHQRSLTGGTSPSQRWSWSPGAFRMSPVQSRARTPVRIAADDTGEYFPLQPYWNLRPLSTASEPVEQQKRRKSGSGGSSSSVGLMMAVKEAGD